MFITVEVAVVMVFKNNPTAFATLNGTPKKEKMGTSAGAPPTPPIAKKAEIINVIRKISK
jgi:hypothetical protein